MTAPHQQQSPTEQHSSTALINSTPQPQSTTALINSTHQQHSTTALINSTQQHLSTTVDECCWWVLLVIYIILQNDYNKVLCLNILGHDVPSIKPSPSFLILGRSGGGAIPTNPFSLPVTKLTISYSFSYNRPNIMYNLKLWRLQEQIFNHFNLKCHVVSQ